MICPRCDSDTAELLVTSPVGKVWEVYLCATCQFSWRSTEDDGIRDPAEYDPRFKIRPAEIPTMSVIPPVPPLLKK
jgi:protein-arginine kinase activator protein McsA